MEFKEGGAPDAERLSTRDIVTARDFSPIVDTPFSMSDFTGGVGQLEFDFNDETAYMWSTGVITHVKGKAFPAPAYDEYDITSIGVVDDIVGFLTHIADDNTRYDFLWSGSYLLRKTDNVSSWELVYNTAGADITDFCIMDGAGFVAVPSAASSVYDFGMQSDVTAAAVSWSVTAMNHTPFSNVAGKPKYFKVIRGTFYAFVDNNGVYYTTDPSTDSWSGPINTSLSGNISGPPGDTSYGFVGASAVGDFMFARKKDAIYSIDSQQEVSETIWQWKEKPSEHNFKYASSGGDQLVFSVGPEVYIFDPHTGFMEPINISRKDSFSVTEILGVAADNQFVFVLAKVKVPTIRLTSSYALFGAYKKNGTWVFEVIWEEVAGASTYATLAAIPLDVGTKLYWGKNSSGTVSTMYMVIPSEWDQSGSGNIRGAVNLWTSLTRAGFPGFQKRNLYTNVICKNIDYAGLDAFINVYYSVNEFVSESTLGPTLTDHQEYEYENSYGTSYGLLFNIQSDGTECPILKSFDHHQRIRFKYLPSVTLAIRVADNLETRDGYSNLTVQEIWANIIALRTSNKQIVYRDFLGNEFNVTIDMIGVRPTRHEAPTEYEEEALVVISRADSGE